MPEPTKKQRDPLPNSDDAVKELLRAHLAEYDNIFSTILQLRDQQNRLTNYGLIAIAAVLAAGASLYKDKPLDDLFWLLDFGAINVFMILIWHHIYVDRTMFKMTRYLMEFLEPAIRKTLENGLRLDGTSVEPVMLFEQWFFRRIGHPEKSIKRLARFWDAWLGSTRYAVPILGAIFALAGLAYRWLSTQPVPPEIINLWNTAWPSVYFYFGLAAFILTMGAFSLLAVDLGGFWKEPRKDGGKDSTG